MRVSRVAGSDPGTSSLDVVVLEDGKVVVERRWLPEELARGADSVVAFLEAAGPLDLVAAPSGYGLPLIRSADLSRQHEGLLGLVRPDDRDRARGVVGLMKVVRALRDSALPVIFLPGGIHLPTIPPHRKVNRVDMGTPDKICVVALAIETLAARLGAAYSDLDLLVVEIGAAFSAVFAVSEGRIVDARAGSFGPVGLGAAGALDGEFAYLCGSLSKDDLFAGGVGPSPSGIDAERIRESIVQEAGALTAITPVEHVVLQPHGLGGQPIVREIIGDLRRFGAVTLLESLPGSKLKCAAQGAALIADGLAGGRHRGLIEHLEIPRASGSVLDHLGHPRAEEMRRMFR